MQIQQIQESSEVAIEATHAATPTSAAEKPSPSLRVVVLNWNLAADTLACVDSLLADGFALHEIIVVDNGSTLEVESLARELPAGVGRIFLPTNRGFAGGNNSGVAAALDLGAEWILLLNNDTLVEKGARVALLDAASHSTFALLSPLILYAEPPPRIWSLGDRRLFGTLLTRSLLRNQIPPPLPPLVPVDFLTACALLVRADVFRRVGLLDEGYFMYAEDADFCLRAAQAGYTLACATEARILHKVSRSTGSAHPASRGWRLESQARFYRLHAGFLQLVLILMPFTLLRALLMAGRDAAGGRWPTAVATLKGWLRGWVGSSDNGANAAVRWTGGL